MRIESRLCHLTENKAVVRVNGWLNEKNIGSALAEGSTVEIAEDKAISRLNKRINGATNIDLTKKSSYAENVIPPEKGESFHREVIDNNNINNVPSDWSNELTAIDIELQRLKWTRDDENNFLEKALGYKNRNKITNYSDILKYLSLIKKTTIKTTSNLIDEDTNNLMEESELILRDLSWDYKQGREYLQKEFNVSTRKELNEEQLLSFIEKLKSIRNKYLAH